MSLWLNKWEKKFLLAVVQYAECQDWYESDGLAEGMTPEQFDEKYQRLLNKIRDVKVG